MTATRTTFHRLAAGLDAEYRRLRTLHPEHTQLLAEAFAAAFAVAVEIVEGEGKPP